MAWDAAKMPTRPGSPARRRTKVLARLVTLGLVGAAAAVVITATGQGRGSPQAQVAAHTGPSVVLTDGQPVLVQITGAERRGDAILLRVDVVGAGGSRTLVVSPGAHVVGQSLQQLLDAAADPGNVIHKTRYHLSYDANGAIVEVSPAH
jgi:hypothetical protein